MQLGCSRDAAESVDVAKVQCSYECSGDAAEFVDVAQVLQKQQVQR